MVIGIKDGALKYGNKKVLSDINFTVKKGQCVVICGESGSGKSSLLKVINGLVPELYEGQLSGEFTVLGQKLPTTNFNDYAKEIGMVFQNPKTQFFMNDVYSELAFPMENCGESREIMKHQIKTISSELNLTSFWQKSLHHLSGGEKQQIAFGSASIMPRQLFLLDEPSSNLDDKHIKQIKNHLLWLKKQNQTIIIAEHRLHYLMPLMDRLIVMKNGQIIEEFTKLNIEKMTEKKKALLNLRTFENPQLMLSKKENNTSLPANKLRCENITFSHKKNDLNLNIEQLTFSSNEITAIVGENGAGKTTLLHLLTGMLKAKSGTIFYNDIKQRKKQLINNSFLIIQDVNLQLFFETVEKEITAKATRLELKELVIETLNLRELLMKHPQTLSVGQKQCVAIAAAVLSGKQVIVMDEPTSGLDLKQMHEVKDIIKKLKAFNVIIIIVSHDKEFINLCCDRVVKMTRGEIN